MTPAEWSAVLDALAKAEAVVAHHAERLNRDPRGLRLAQDAVRALRATVATAAPLTPVLGQPVSERWAYVAQAACVLGITNAAAQRRAQRGLADGTGRKVGGRLQLRLTGPSDLSSIPNR